ncbi:transposase [bacterium]|nr:transposase [bacterium]
MKRECLNHFLVLNKKHLDYLMKENIAHYNTERPYQSLSNKPLIQLPVQSKNDVKCKEQLGGLLRHYYREAV